MGLLARSAAALLILGALAAAPPAIAAPRAAAAPPVGAPAPAGAAARGFIVRFQPGIGTAARREAVRAAGGLRLRDLHLIGGVAARLSPASARRLARARGVLSVTPDGRVAAAGVSLPTTFDLSTRAATAWVASGGAATGRGVGVAVVDTGIAAGLPDFGRRVVAAAVTNSAATTPSDLYGHGTAVAGLVAGAAPPYVGTAPAANLVSIKVSDDHGDATVADAIAGLQYAVDHRADYGVRVVNLSLDSTEADSYLTDPLDAAAEAAWRHGLVVVAAAGNLGSASDAVSYAPANDPYVITVGGVDEHGTPAVGDDTVGSWSSRGRTQDGFAKPDVVAPGAHIVGPLAPGSDFAAQCPACVVGGRYIRLSGTSMAAPIVAGIAADLLSAHPRWTPDMVKGALVSQTRRTADGAREVAADLALVAPARVLTANAGLTPSTLLDPATGTVDPSRASWGRASWGRASWSSLFG